MRATRAALLTWIGCLALLASAGAQTPVGTAFTYQGRLTDNGSPASGVYDLQFVLYTASTGGSQVGPIVIKDDVTVTSGLFTASLDFGAASFAGEARWLEVGTRPGSSTGSFSILSPRQELSPAPNAVFSQKAPWAGLSGVPAGFADGVDNDLLGGISCANGQIARWNGAAWVCVADSGHDHLGQTWTGSGSLGLSINSQAPAGIGVAGGADGWGIYGTSSGTAGRGVYGSATAATGDTSGVYGRSSSTAGRGIRGENTATAGAAFGVYGTSASTGARAVFGYAPAATGQSLGVYGQSDSTAGTGVEGYVPAASGNTYGVRGGSGSTAGTGVRGYASATAGTTYGVYGESASPAGRGVYGTATATTGTTYGVYGESASAFGRGVYGRSSGVGVYGEGTSTGGQGVLGLATTAGSIGVMGEAYSTDGRGVYGWAPATGWAGWFLGNVSVIGTLSKGGGSFKIDHPLDPENKYLYHSFVESPDMMNVYNGNVTTDQSGYATVELPEWFEALNRDFRYQLTVLDDADNAGFVQAKVAKKIAGNRFTIRSSAPWTEVSWQVTGIRKDGFAEKHRIPVEQDKPEAERGLYLHPDAFGQPEEKGVDYKDRTSHARPGLEPPTEPEPAGTGKPGAPR